MSPDSTGKYRPIGTYNGKTSYARDDNAWFIWWDGIDSWIISTVIGTEGVSWWFRADPTIVGAYIAGGTATGAASVAEI